MDIATVKDLLNIILKQDWSQTVNSVRNHPSVKHGVFVAASWLVSFPDDFSLSAECEVWPARLPAGVVIGI